MRTSQKSLFLLHALIAGLGFIQAGRVMGQSFMTLHSFTLDDGANPEAGLILSGDTLYGTAAYGGSSSNGTVFKTKTDGTGFTSLYSFTATSGFPDYKNNDGVNPSGGLVILSNVLYGTAVNGGSSGDGTAFAVNTDGTGFTTLHSFTFGSDGANPNAGLLLSG